MNRLHKCLDLLSMAEENEYKILLSDDNFFLGYDLVRSKYCIVYYKFKKNEYILDSNIKTEELICK